MLKFSVTSYKGYNTKENGQHGTELAMIVSGEQGACVWRFATGVGPMGPWPSMDPDSNMLAGVNIARPMGMGFVAHSELNERTAHEEDYTMNDSCEFLEGRPCVCDYQYSLDNQFTQAFACEGFSGVERILTEHYVRHYGVSE